MSTTRSTVSSTKASASTPKTAADFGDAANNLRFLDLRLEDIIMSRSASLRNRSLGGLLDPPDDNSTGAMMGSFDGFPGEEEDENDHFPSPPGMVRGVSLEASNLKAHDDDIERQEREEADLKKKKQDSSRKAPDEGIDDIGQRRSPIEMLLVQKQAADSTKGLLDEESDYRDTR